MSVCFDCCVLSGGGLCVGLIVRPEGSSECYCKASENEEALSYKGLLSHGIYILVCRSQWPCGLRRRSAAACLLRLWGMDVCLS